MVDGGCVTWQDPAEGLRVASGLGLHRKWDALSLEKDPAGIDIVCTFPLEKSVATILMSTKNHGGEFIGVHKRADNLGWK